MWVESDTNMPGGEAMARQFVAGKRFFLDEFGVDCAEVWLPDSFGYSAALPQIVAAAGARYFLTQKISWNQTNRMPHHTFWWQGIDGTRVFTHFPPVDTYNSELVPAELAHAERNYADHGRGSMSLVPFGFGDGGGGPTREMIARGRRARSLEGSPTVEFSTPRTFFDAGRRPTTRTPPVWVGEMYLELHRGTYTSQSRTKQGNRRSEHLLREAELWATTAAVLPGADYPYDELEKHWQTVLLQQFHDILPGSSIAWVYRDAERNYAELAADLEDADRDGSLAEHWPVRASRPITVQRGPARAGRGARARRRRRPPTRGGPDVRLTEDGDAADAGQRPAAGRASTAGGLLTSLIDLADRPRGRSRPAARQPAAAAPGRPERMGRLGRRRALPPARRRSRRGGVDHRRAATADRATVRVAGRFGELDVRAGHHPGPRRASARDRHHASTGTSGRSCSSSPSRSTCRPTSRASETQFGHVFRPTHTNTSWEAAKFEICAHRWIHVGEPGFGVAITNDSHLRPRRHHGGARATAAPRRPCGCRCCGRRCTRTRTPTRATHVFRTLLVPGAEIADAVSAGYRTNLPLRSVAGARDVAPIVDRVRTPRWWSRRSSSPRTGPATSSSGSTNRSGGGRP